MANNRLPAANKGLRARGLPPLPPGADEIEIEDAWRARPWSEEDVDRLRAAASDVLRMWTRHLDHLTEQDRVALRGLVAALDRDPRD